MKIRTLLCSAAVAATTAFGAAPAARAEQALTKVSVSMLYITADIGVFWGLERGYYKEQGLELELQRATSGADAISQLASNKLDVGSGSASPGLYNAFKRGLPIQIVMEKASLLPPGEDSASRIMVRRDLMESGAVKTCADLKGKRIAVNNLQSTSLNFPMRCLEKAGLGQNDVTWVELPMPQFVPAFEKKAVDAAVVFTPFTYLLEEKLKSAVSLPGSGGYILGPGDALSIMLYSDQFANTEAAKKFATAYLKAQYDYQRMLERGDTAPICRTLNKYVPSMPADCTGLGFTGVRTDATINLASLERFQNEWIKWGVMKAPAADIGSHVNLEFLKYAVSQLGPYKK
jgi:NitT/TauT family transport system substrate-binding protein